MKQKQHRLRKIICILLCLCFLGLCALLGANAVVKHCAAGRILSPEEAAAIQDMDCILVLGCLVKDNGNPSAMLHDRLTRGVALYDMAAAPKLLMSGDHGRMDYDEVDAMKQFAVDANVPSEDVFMDHAGFSTYESIYRAREIFGVQKVIIVTQEYHLHRALYIAERLGVEAYGVASDYRTYSGQTMRDLREVLARAKDLITCIFKPEPTYLGNAIPIYGDGNLTNDEFSDFS